MARTTYVFNYTNAAVTEENIKRLLAAEQFALVYENGENIWKCGNGVLSSIKYIKYDFINANTLHFTGWIKSDLGGEFNLEGYLLGYHKKKTREVIDRIKTVIR